MVAIEKPPDVQQLEDGAWSASVALLEQLRQRVVASIASAPDEIVGGYKRLLAEIDGYVAAFQRDLTAAMGQHVELAAAAGDNQVLWDLDKLGGDVPLSYLGVDPVLVQTAADYSASLVTALANDARAKISNVVRLGSLGGSTTGEMIEEVGKNLFDPSTFSTIAARAEAIVRTEVARVRNTAYHEQGQQLAERYDWVEKEWVHAVSAPGATKHQRAVSRPNHVALDGTRLPFKERFDLGDGITAAYPHEWSLPASEVVNCRCRLKLVKA